MKRSDPKQAGQRSSETSRRLRPLNEPRAIAVSADELGAPESVSVGRKHQRVEEIREIWRIDDEWWRRPVSRLYYAVVLHDGRSMTLYRDLAKGGWFIQA